jgi:outer membrane protein assembly factor BamB
MRLFALALLLSTLGGAVLGCGAATARRVTDDQREMPANVAHLRWRTVIHDHNMFEPKPEECATGVVVGSRVIVGSRAGKVVGLATSDGRTLWNTGISGGSDGEARFDQARNQVYVGSDDGYLYAIDTDGKIRWSYKSKGSIDRMPEVGGDLVYAATSTDRVVSLDAATGKYRWGYEREVPEGFTIHGHAGPRLHEATDQFVVVDTTPAFVGDLVVASSYSGGLYALRARDGDVRWRLNIEGASALRLTEGRLYVAAPREGLAALTPDGQFIWRQGLAEAGDLTPPTAVGPYLVFSGSRAGLFIVERASGKLLQLFNPGRGACAAPAIDAADNHRLYLLANSGSLYALDLVY